MTLISFLRILVLIPLLLYGVLGLLIPDFAQARHAVMLTFGLSFVVLLDAALAALEARRQASSRQTAALTVLETRRQAAVRRPSVFLGDPGRPPADPRLN